MSIPETMMAAVATTRGGRLELRRVPTPRPGPGELLVRVEAAGVNFSDVKRRRGDAYPFETGFPFVPGSEIVGTVAALGAGVEGPRPGTRVLALAGPTGFGGYAQFATSFAPTAQPLPPGLPARDASTLLVAGTTARLLLVETARVRPGEWVLVPAATGGVGTFLVRMARNLDARVVAAVGAASKVESARALGADAVVVTDGPGWPAQVRAATGGRGVDVALEATGGPELARTLEATAPFGRVVVFGAASGVGAALDADVLGRFLYAPAPNQSLAAFNLGGWFMERPAEAGAATAAVVADVLSGRLRVPPLRALPLSAADDAHRLLETRAVSGKLVLEPWASTGGTPWNT